jgi:hypothetical protein
MPATSQNDAYKIAYTNRLHHSYAETSFRIALSRIRRMQLGP